MVKPERYQKKKRIYTRWDKLTEEVRIISEKKLSPPIKKQFTDKIDIPVEEKDLIAHYANELAVHFREGEFVLDFLRRAKENKLLLVSRILLSPRLVKKLIRILEA